MSHESPIRRRASGRATSAAIAVAFLGCGLGGCIGYIGKSDHGDAPPPLVTSQSACEAGPSAERSPLRRLTRAEYRATIRDLLGIPAPALDDFVSDETRGAFDLDVSAPSELAIEKLRASAEAFAAQARERFAEGCDVEETACATDFVTTFGLHAYRRPLDADEIAELVGLYEGERGTSDGATALELVVQTILMSPHFLYHVEVGRPDATAGSAVPLGGYEIASRLSYFLWGTLPDDALFEAADDGALDSPEGIEKAARRMLADPKAMDMLAEFQRQWLDLRAVDDVVRDPTVFPEWTPELLQSMKTETRTFFEEVIFHGDAKLETLLAAPYSYLDAPLAEHYGAPAPDAAAANDDGVAKVDLPADERAGLLTQGLVLVTHAYPAKNSWVHRGKFVRERLLCSPLPPPPPNIDFSNTNDPNRLTNEQCKGCHLMMDPIGKAFDTYDPTGHFATVDAEGKTIDAHGEVHGSEIGAFGSIVELAGDLAADPTVHACIAYTWATYALGRPLAGDGACAQASLVDAFDASGHDLRELFVAIAKSDAFRFTRTEP